MSPIKAPSLDWYRTTFVGPRIIIAYLEVLNFCKLMLLTNHTNLVLIPKKKDPKTVVDYKPISLCNTV